MLTEEQAAELLRRCEQVAGRQLTQIRGNLRRASTRAAAVWELLVLEAAAQLGDVRCESEEGGPDVRLRLPTGRWASIEVAYLRPRFEDITRKSSMVARWMHESTARLSAQPPTITCRFHGDDHPAGPKVELPDEHEKKQFFAHPEIAGFLALVAARPLETHQQRLTSYSITLTSHPYNPQHRETMSWGGPAPEAPRIAKEHAAFRVLRGKIRQHKVEEPHLICIGSDVSPALSAVRGPHTIRLEDALSAGIGTSEELSGVLIVHIETALGSHPLTRVARCTAYPTARSRYPLTDTEWKHVRRLNLNRWKYSFALSSREAAVEHRHRHVPGSLTYSPSGGRVKLKLPASVLADVLSGRKKLLNQYGNDQDMFSKQVMACLAVGWAVTGCRFENGDVQAGKAAMVELELGPPHDPVFWPRN